MENDKKVSSFKNLSSKVLLIIGKTGTGKSSLCNRISGYPSNSSIFPVSGGAISCTQNTVLGSVHFNGDQDKPVGLIDTIGFDDPNNDTDVRVIADLVDKLKNNCNFVNLFGIAVNGQSPRLDGSLVAMIRIFEEMFGEQFWKQCVLIFTRMSMDRKNKRLREKNAGKPDDDIASEYMQEVEKKFPNSRGTGVGLRYLFLDACFDEEDEHEEEEYKSSMDNLYKMLAMAPRLNTSEVNGNVKSEHGKLKRKIEENERQRKEELAKHAEQMRLLQEEAEEKRQEDLRRLEEQTRRMQDEQERKHREDMQKLTEETARKREEDLRRQAREARILQEETERRFQEDIHEMQQEAEEKRQDDLRRQKEEVDRVREEGERERRRHQEDLRRVKEEERRRSEEKQQQVKRQQNTGVDQVFILIFL